MLLSDSCKCLRNGPMRIVLNVLDQNSMPAFLSAVEISFRPHFDLEWS